MSNKMYKDYIKVEPDYIPVFTRGSDSRYPRKWLSFNPHESFKTILKSVLAMLKMGKVKDNWSQWMSGAYGTGKTFASFTIKHILEDNIDDVRSYFQQNEMEDLLSKLEGIRKENQGNILVVHHSSSAGITNQNILFNTIVAAVRETLVEKGYKYKGSASLYDEVLSILQDPSHNAFNFPAIFLKYKAKFMEYSSPDEVIKDLEKYSPSTEEGASLLDTIVEIGVKERYNWTITPGQVNAWLADVIERNKLYAIVMIWDEFTEFFKNNQNNLTGLQDIAEASPGTHFYFFLITHSGISQLVRDEAALKVLHARFVYNRLHLEDNTALELLGKALGHERDLKKEWDNIVNDLEVSVKGSIKHIKGKDSSAKDSDFKNLFPMHPYASYLLRFIAEDISSNQRTMFQFLSADYSDGTGGQEGYKTNFKWFIDNFGFSYGAWNLLTTDYLWDYFFYTDNVNLDGSFMDVISYYNNYEGLCEDGENREDGDYRRKVFKVALLLTALHRKNAVTNRSGATALLRPTDKNIKACFTGTPIENRVQEFLDFLAEKRILGAIEDSEGILYVITTVGIDREKFKEAKQESLKHFPFSKIINDDNYEVARPLVPSGFMQWRCDLMKVTTETAKTVAGNYSPRPNTIALFYLFAKNEVEQGKSKKAIDDIYGKITDRCIVVDFTSVPFTDSRYDKFINSKAEEQCYMNSNQQDQVKLAKRNAVEAVKEWDGFFGTASLRIYSEANKSEVVSGVANLKKKLEELNSKFYECGLENIAVGDRIFQPTGFQNKIAEIAIENTDISGNNAYIKPIYAKLDKSGILADPQYWKNKPSLIVSRMKAAVEQKIQDEFDEKTMVSMLDIWKVLISPPFGLLPCAGAVYIMGFLLKEYAGGTYYKQDINNNSTNLNSINLSELILAAVKNIKGIEDQYIVLQKPEHNEFCKITGKIFKISKDNCNSISDIDKSVKTYLIENIYPLWSLVYYVKEKMADDPLHDELIKIINLLCEFINPESKLGRDKPKVAEEINSIYKQNPGIEKKLGAIIPNDYLRDGMEYYIASRKPKLADLASKLGITTSEYLYSLTAKFSHDSSYLWLKKDIDQQIDNLYIDLQLIDAINKILAQPQKSYEKAKEGVEDKLNSIKVPRAIIEEYHANLKPMMEQLYAIINDGVTDKSKTVNIIIEKANDFRKFFEEKQFKTFSAAVKARVDEKVSADELADLYKDVPSEVIFCGIDDFVISIRQALDNSRKDKKIKKLSSLWTEVTGTESPSQWSKNTGIPLLCMFKADFDIARQAFAALNNTSNLSDKEIDAAIKFVKGPKLNVLKNIPACEKEFIECFCGKYAYIIENTDELRKKLHDIAGDDVYEWYFHIAQCAKELENMAIQLYKDKYSVKAMKKVSKLTAEDAKKYLEESVKNDPLLGIRILQEK